MTAIFRVHGPFSIPRSDEDHICIAPRCPDFWQQPEVGKFAGERGCYVFATQAGEDIRPVYVGKTTRSFEEECFTHRNVLNHYQHAALATKDGMPVLPLMFLLVLDRTKGPINTEAIAELESFLIHNAAARNPRLSNIQGTRAEEWGIAGVIRGGKGQTSHAAKTFCNIVGIESERVGSSSGDENDEDNTTGRSVGINEQSTGPAHESELPPEHD